MPERPGVRLPTTFPGWARLALASGWVALLVFTFGIGARPSSLADLEDAVRTGEVDEVRVSGGLSEGAHGFATVQLSWQRGLGHYRAEVFEARPVSAAPSRDLRAVTDVETRLVGLQPGLTIRNEDYSPPGTSAELWGRPVYDGAALALGGLWVSTLLLMIALPQPWRVTRWGWFWLMWGLAPLGSIAYLVLSGPAPFLRPPLDPARRLTGGWAFLLSIMLAFVWSVLLVAV